MEPKLIAIEYIKTWFFLDLLSSIPVEYICQQTILTHNQSFENAAHGQTFKPSEVVTTVQIGQMCWPKGEGYCKCYDCPVP